ncbi:hypothetical protein FHW12_003529 [Dokdonella fugitiva]|uniref:Uncharacterized protein n=1 Tax=Dokdonella fugitiva TaxID=328517 RepID=A0A839F3W8_9GAMM|nr:hypothetical protein [Dokdonella fugitiva]
MSMELQSASTVQATGVGRNPVVVDIRNTRA